MYVHAQVMLVLERLVKHREKNHQLHTLFEHNAQRSHYFTRSFDQLSVDFSRHLIDEESLGLWDDIWQTVNVDGAMQAMLEGKVINQTEGRAALHMALRTPHTDIPLTYTQTIEQDYVNMQKLAKKIADLDCDTIIHLGVGGSDLGPKMLHHALSHLHDSKYHVHFIANIDPSSLIQCMQNINPQRTLVIACSKTFTTLETMTQLKRIQQYWQLPSRHIIAITSQIDKAKALGIEHILHFPEWIGGRFSVWSAVGFVLHLCFGPQVFNQLLMGANSTDQHVLDCKGQNNIAWFMAMLGVYYRHAFHAYAHCIAPYGDAFKYLPAYLQQLDMESNGKSIGVDGQLLPYATTGVLFGEVGSTCQHSYFQHLHQSRDMTPVDFVCYRRAHHFDQAGHEQLRTQCYAQAQALMLGNPYQMQEAHTYQVGNRPSSVIEFETLNAYHLGQLLALYEHKTFYQSLIWRINPFDQWGVELAKKIARNWQKTSKQKSTDAVLS